MAEELQFIGKRIPTIESVAKVRGSVKYIADMTVPGMLHGKFFRSPHAHAKVTRIDTSKAEKIPGVRLILTPDDIIGKIRPVGLTQPKNQYALHKEVRYIGDEIAVVAAISEEAAQEAADLIEVTYEELPVVLDPEESMVMGAPRLHDEERNIREPKRVRVGDIERGFKEAECAFEATFQTSKQAHVTLDTHGCLSWYDPASEKLTHWTPTQSVFMTRLDLAEALNMPASRIRVIVPEAIGAGFGSKIWTFPHDVCAALMSKKLGKPIRIILTREEEFIAVRTRNPFTIHAEVGLKKDGTIVAWREKAIMDIGAYADWTPYVAIHSQALTPGPYKIPNIWIDTLPVYTNKSISGAFRGFGNPQATFARESLIDIAAEHMGIDRIELRLRNIIKPGDLPYTTSTGLVVRSCGIEECIKKATDAIGWSKKRKPYTGVGLACMIHDTGNNLDGADFSSATLEIAADGSVIVSTGNSDIGEGLYTLLAQISAEELGIPMERVTLIGADSEVTPADLGCYASKSAFLTGSAVKGAAKEAKEKLFRIAAKMLEINPDDLIAKGGKIYVKDLSTAIPIEDVARAAYFTPIDGAAGPIIGRGFWASQTVPPNENGYGNYSAAYPFAATAVEVEVDTRTGEVRITKYVTAHDVGRALNVSTVEGQLQGGAGQGIGFGLFEEGLSYDGKTGQPLNPSIMGYNVPTAMDLPDIQLIIAETLDPAIPFGNKGVGETGLICAAAAIANAISDAIGIRIKSLPITPEKILEALKEKTAVD